jgi:hypothetical protein
MLVFIYVTGCSVSGSDDAKHPAIIGTSTSPQPLAGEYSCPNLKTLALDKAKFPAGPPSKVVLKHSTIGKSGDLTLGWWREASGRTFPNPPVYLDTVGPSKFSLCEDGITFGDLALAPQDVNRIRDRIRPDSIKYILFVPVVGSPNTGSGSYKVLYYKIYVRASLNNLATLIPKDDEYGFLFDINPSPPATAF